MLIVGGAGGVGSIAIQMLKKVAGMQVIASASRDVSAQHCLGLGADGIVNHTAPIGSQLHALGIDSLDALLHCSEPDDNIEELMPLMAPFGKMVCILPVNKPISTGSLFARSISLVYELMFTKGLFQKDLSRQGEILDKVACLVEAGTLKSTLTDRFPWSVEGLRSAHDRIDRRQGLGKAVLSITGD